MEYRIFTTEEIASVYERYVKKDESYFQKYVDLTPHFDGRIETVLRGSDYPRIPCLLDFKEWIGKYNIIPQKMLCTDISDFELNYISPKELNLFKYDGTSGDLHAMNLSERDYDFFLFSQTIEHLFNPILCLKNIYDHLAPGGWVFTSVPAINIPHMTPYHFSGVYPMGLALAFMSVGFEVMEVGQWGNLSYLGYIFTNHQWPDYYMLSNLGAGRITNEERNIAQCWILVRKPL
jgi:SAM-dependent methyltransferase